MSNLLEQLVWDLPKEQKSKINKADCHFSDGYCDSIDIIADYIHELENKNKKLENDNRDLGAINIILEQDPASPACTFVEVENDKGRSIRIGKFSKRDDGFTVLRIEAEDIINHLSI